MILTDYHIGIMGAIRANADYGQVEILDLSGDILTLGYLQRGKEMVAVVYDSLKTVKTMPKEIYENPPEEAPVISESTEESPDENNESA